MEEQNKSIERKGNPKECEGRFHDGMNGTWKCWECGMIGGGFNDAPPTNKSIKEIGFYDHAKTAKLTEVDIQNIEFDVLTLHNKLNEVIQELNKII